MKDATYEPVYHHAIWFVGNKRGDWMGKLVKQDGKWLFEYRFRYYDPADPQNDAWSGKDTKSWYAFQSKDDSDEQRDRLLYLLEHGLIPMLEARYGNKVDVVDLQCRNDEQKFFDAITSRPWCHAKEVTPEEFEAMKQEGRV